MTTSNGHVSIFKKKVGKVWLAAISQAELDEAVAHVRANTPMLTQFVRFKSGPMCGYISAIDNTRTPPRVQCNEGPTWVSWSKLEYA